MVALMNDDRKDLERGNQGLTKALSWNVPRDSEESHEGFSQDRWRPGKD
jgi:hypothetical protein